MLRPGAKSRAKNLILSQSSMPPRKISETQWKSAFAIFFFNDTATCEIYTLSLHDALPIWRACLFHLQSPLEPQLGLLLIGLDGAIRLRRLREGPHRGNLRGVEIEQHLAGNRLHFLPCDVDRDGAAVGDDLQLR